MFAPDVFDVLFQQADSNRKKPRITKTVTLSTVGSQWLQEMDGFPLNVREAVKKYCLRIPEARIKYRRQAKWPNEMTPKEAHVYQYILNTCGTEEKLLRLYDRVQSGPSKRFKHSGRNVDTLMTKYPKNNPVHYYLDVTNSHEDPKYVPLEAVASYPKDRKLQPFDICASYQFYMRTWNKTFFDPFGRGVEVKHQLSTGKYIIISLCKFMFFMWALKFGVFDFLDDHHEAVERVQKLEQHHPQSTKVHYNHPTMWGPMVPLGAVSLSTELPRKLLRKCRDRDVPPTERVGKKIKDWIK